MVSKIFYNYVPLLTGKVFAITVLVNGCIKIDESIIKSRNQSYNITYLYHIIFDNLI